MNVSMAISLLYITDFLKTNPLFEAKLRASVGVGVHEEIPQEEGIVMNY
jgi:DNA helicase TIP49 (TBP-interacting protein)